MKKPRLCALLVSSVMLLTSCDFLSMLNSYIPSADTTGSTDSAVGVEASEGGVETTLAEGLKKAQVAVTKTMAQDSIAIATSIPSLELHMADVTYTADTNASGANDSTSSMTGSCYYRNYIAKNATLDFAATGLMASEQEALKASCKVNAESFSYSELTADVADNSVDKATDTHEFSSVTGAAYVNGNDLYVDASNTDFRSGLGYVLGLLNINATLGEKSKFSGVLANIARPIVHSTDLDAYVAESLKFAIEKVDFFDKFFDVTTYEDGSSMIYANLGSSDFMKIVALIESSTSSVDYDTAYAALRKTYDYSSLNLGLALTFNDSGITKFVINGTGKIVVSPTKTLEENIDETTTRTVTTAHTYKFAADVTSTFSYGEGIKVELPEDLSVYADVAY